MMNNYQYYWLLNVINNCEKINNLEKNAQRYLHLLTSSASINISIIFNKTRHFTISMKSTKKSTRFKKKKKIKKVQISSFNNTNC